MKRKKDIFNKIIDINNLKYAHYRAKRGKANYREVKEIDENPNLFLYQINKMLIKKTYKTSQYKTITRVERFKEREIKKLPYFPDRIIHHALLQQIQPILEKTYIKDTYQSIVGRGVHKAKDRVINFMKDKENTKYCLKIDIKKYYPNIDNEILKALLRKKIKCKDTLWLCDEIIDSTKGLPIGNYTSQTFGNYYLSFFDHFVKEDLKVKFYIRYADDMVFFASTKEELHTIKHKAEEYLRENLKLTIKENWQIFEVRKRGLDFLGFRFFGDYILLRKTISKAFQKIIKKIKNFRISEKLISGIMSYYGWIKASNSYNLFRSSITKDNYVKISMFCKKLGIKNPLKAIVIVPKNNINIYGRYQPTLF
jgi:hypothetical protein